MPMRKPKKIKAVAKNCPFCAQKTEPDYKDVALLERYLTERGKIIGKARTGLCSKHQRAIGISIKRARQVALLPFIVRV